METTATILKYLDIFGTRCTFYSDKMPKLYTVRGGIFSLLSLLIYSLVFLIFILNELKRKNPITTTSFIPSEGYKNIKFGDKKIWILWRIVDYNNNEYINHTGILFPIIYYFSGIKNNLTKEFNFKTKFLNYKLCNETSMANENNFYKITVPLNELYCIEMDNLDMGGSWITEFINYIQFDLYYCEEGIEYNETNPKCTSYDKIRDFIGENNSLSFDLYYPIIQFQPTNKTNPVILIYKNHFFHLSKYVNKIERLYFQETVLTDDSGFLFKKEENSSFLGLNSINGDIYFNGNENDLFNEGSNSRAYSFNIYLDPGIIHYKRYYKKIYSIFTDFFPIGYFIYIILKYISKLFKEMENNKKMVESLFENLKEKSNEFEENLDKLRIKNNYLKQKTIFYRVNEKNHINNEFKVSKKKRLSVDFSSNLNSCGKNPFKMIKRNTNNSKYNFSPSPKNKKKYYAKY